MAGVSLSTASKVLSGTTERISEETRIRVREAAARLDFRPNALAQSFALGRSDTIGVLTYRAASTFTGPVLVGVVLELGANRQAALVYDEDILGRRQITESIRRLQARQIDGLIVVGDGHEHLSPSITHEFQVPVTYAFAASESPEDVVFLPDNFEAGRIATRHLIERGRTRIAHITADSTAISVQLREKGMLAELAAAGLQQAAPTRYGAWSQAWGAEATEGLLASGVPVDAIFCGNDHMALGALDVLRRRGVRVPEDIAIVGVDNWEGIVIDQGIRRLTTVDMELQKLGRLAARDVMSGERSVGEQRVAPTLIVGPSS